MSPAREAPARPSLALPLVVAGAVVLLDQVTKALAVAFIERDPVDLGFMRLAVSRNAGSAFSLLQGQVWLFLTVSAAVTVFAVVTLRRPHGRATQIGLALVVGGAWGNLIDRFVRFPGAPNGRVVDFIDFKFWPVFNLADSSIVVGAAVLILFGSRRQPDPRAETGAGREAVS